MDTAPSSPNERERLEQQLLDEMQAAKQDYHSARAEHTKVGNEYGDMLDSVDGSYAVHKAAEHERAALENYIRAWGTFTDFVVYGRRPGSPVSDGRG
jgi:hypothetical protein